MTIGNLIVIAAPSGAGKTSLVKALSESIDKLQVSVSHTTRNKRPGEIDGKDYFFIDNNTFNSMVTKNVFLEHAHVHGREYGTSREWVQSHLSKGIDVILEIDWQGARQIQHLFPSAILIFIFPPSIEALRERLQKRRQDDAQTIEERLQAALDEIQHFSEFDYLVVNDQFEKALEDLKHIVLGARLKMNLQYEKQKPLLEKLLQGK